MLNILGVMAESAAGAAEAGNTFLDLVSIDPGTIVFTLINTLIIFLIFRIFLYKPVCSILEKRREMAAAEIAEAQKAKENAEKAEQEYTARLADAKNEAAEIVKQATLRAQKREEEIVSEANQKAAEIRAKAEENIERDKQRAVNEIKDEISEMVVMAASKVVEKEISAKDNEDIISKFLSEVGASE
ncbi:MAG: F0F1 ATP synthase subunit B [Ruminococcaceae bacterium]|nr:F0F1 ATP synthase subunit B [Oscillospiraceae bacterium]